jgi:diguanylate cyclase (GGDEF)-like protein
MKLHHKIIVMPITVMLTIFIISLVGMEFHLKETLRGQLEHKLRIFASFALSSVIEKKPEANYNIPTERLTNIANRIALMSTSRITYFDDKGEVLADSYINFNEITNTEKHFNRAEISLALKNGEGIAYRYSNSLKKQMVYLALYDEKSSLIVRASNPAEDYQQDISAMRWGFLIIIFVSIVVVVIFGVLAIGLIKKAVNNERALQESRIIARTREITLIQTMTTMLNAAHTLDDAAIVLLNIMPKLLPSLSGAIFLLDEQSSLNEVSHWGKNWHHDIATMTKNRWTMKVQSPDKDRLNSCHSAEYSFCIDLIHEGEFIGILQLVAEEKMINEQYQHLMKKLAPQLSSALTNIQLKDSLRNQAIRDPLTELYNRRFMLEAFEQALNRAERHNGCLAVLMIDLDHFKNFNDTYGHEAGDKVLIMVAEQFKMNLRLEDIACRYGGEEFCILCPDTGLREAHILAEKLRHCVAEKQITYQKKLLDKVTLSIGIAIYPNHGRSSNELLQQADKALYEAKDHGRNCTVVTRIKVPHLRK